jgi:hypothetical protein
LLTGIGFTGLDMMRGDVVPLIGQWRLDSLFDTIIGITGGFLMVVIIIWNVSSRQRKD